MSTTDLPIAAIAPSRGNPRKTFNKAALAELTDSVRKHGVLQPVLVRPLMAKNGKTHELVAGHRRLRAAVAAGLEVVPALVREISDKEVLEIQVVENLQREDLHPLEEAEGYRRLTKDFDYSVDELADKVGKSRAYVYSRMKLAELPPKAVTLFREGKLTPSTALLVARVPDRDLAEEAAEEICRGDGCGSPMSYREAQDWIRHDFMQQLKGAPFRTNDAELLPEVGACTDCPKRTGNQPDLFGDVSADVCTDPKCFRQKADAAYRAKVAAAIAKGGREATAAERKRLVANNHLRTWEARRAGLLDLGTTNYEAPKSKTWRALLGKDCPPVVLLQDPQTGRAVELVSEAAALKVLREKYSWAKRKRSTSASLSAAEKRGWLNGKIRAETLRRGTGELAAKIERKDGAFQVAAIAEAQLWREFAKCLVRSLWADTIESVVTRRELRPAGEKKRGKFDAEALLCKAIDEARGDQVLGIVFELVAARSADTNDGDHEGDWRKLAMEVGVDLGAIKKKVAKELTKPLLNKKAKKKRGTKK